MLHKKKFPVSLTKKKMSWIEKRAEFQERFDELAEEDISGLVANLNKTIARYIDKGGVNIDSNNPEYTTIVNITKEIEQIKNTYVKLNEDINKYIIKESQNPTLSSLLKSNGKLQQEINSLEKIKKAMTIDVESAIARDELLRSKDTDITRHNLFLLDRPIRKALIPYLWVFAIFFIGVGLLIFKMSIPTVPYSGGFMETVAMVIEVITNKYILGAALIAAIITIIFLSMAVAGVFKKK